jgi:hypothetical protein
VRLGRRRVIDEDDRDLGGVREFSVEALVRVLVAEYPAAAVAVEDDRQGVDDPGGLTIRISTSPVGPPAIMRSSISAAGWSTSTLVWIDRSTSRASCGESSYTGGASGAAAPSASNQRWVFGSITSMSLGCSCSYSLTPVNTPCKRRRR